MNTFISVDDRLLFGWPFSSQERENFLIPFYYEINPLKLAFIKSVIDYAKGTTLSLEEKKQFFDAVVAIKKHYKDFEITEQLLNELNTVLPYINYDANIAVLLEDYMLVKQWQKQEYSLSSDFNFANKNYAANKQQVIKEVLNALPPLSKAMVEFASFYVPKNLSQEREVEIVTFLNRDNEYAKEIISLENLSIKRALTGENPLLLQDLREFFVAEGQAQHNISAAVYVGYMFSLAAKFTEQHARYLDNYIRIHGNDSYLYFHFNDLIDKFVIYLEKLSDLKSLNNAIGLAKYIDNNKLWQDAVNLYNQAGNFIGMQTPNLLSKVEAYFANANHDSDSRKFIDIMAQIGAKKAFEQANINATDVLPASYWLAQVQSQGFYFMHNLLSNKVTELSQPIMYTVIAYRSALAGQPNETKSYLTKAKDYLKQDEAFDMLAQYGEFYFNARNDFDNYLADFAASNASNVNDMLIKYQVLSLWNAFQITHNVNTLLCQATHMSWENLLKDERDTIVARSVIIKMQLNDMQQYAQKLCMIENNQLAKFSCELSQGMHKASLYTAQQILGVLGDEEYESTAAQLSLLQQEALHYQAMKKSGCDVVELKLVGLVIGLHQGNLINTIYVKHSLQEEYQQECELLESLQSDDSLKIPELCDNI